jgi:hypothetical protein
MPAPDEDRAHRLRIDICSLASGKAGGLAPAAPPTRFSFKREISVYFRICDQNLGSSMGFLSRHPWPERERKMSMLVCWTATPETARLYTCSEPHKPSVLQSTQGQPD